MTIRAKDDGAVADQPQLIEQGMFDAAPAGFVEMLDGVG